MKHALGFHGRHWGPMHWYLGNLWVTCQKCGKSRQIGPQQPDQDGAVPAGEIQGGEIQGGEIQGGEIQGNPDDGLAEWRHRNGIIVGDNQ